jgi:DNA polymerase III epsilon subunit-like protein
MLNDVAAWHGKDCPFNRLTLKAMSKQLGVKDFGAHDALADCIATAALYRQFLRLLG